MAFLWACSLPGSQKFSLNLADIEVSGCSASTSKLPDPVDLSNVLEEYHEFADVFDKAKAQTLAPHRPYDLKINLEEGYIYPSTRTSLFIITNRVEGALRIFG